MVEIASDLDGSLRDDKASIWQFDDKHLTKQDHFRLRSRFFTQIC